MKATSVVALLCLLFSTFANAITFVPQVTGPSGELPFAPGVKGYGVYIRPAQNATVYKVTNLNPSGTGSLEDCVNQTGKRVCVFEVAGRIKYADSNRFQINNDNLHIAGQTAPYPGIVIQAAKSAIAANNVIVEHVRFMSSDEHTNSDINNPQGYHDRDALAIEGNLSNVVLNHVTLTFSIDGVLDIWGNVNDITVRNSIIGPPLNYSIHGGSSSATTWSQLEGHPLAFLTGYQGENIDITRSVVAYAYERTPRIGMDNLFYSENVNYLPNRPFFVDLYTRNVSGSNQSIEANVVGNVFITDRSSSNIVTITNEFSGGHVNLYGTQNQLVLSNGASSSIPTMASALRTSDNQGTYNVSGSPRAMPHAQTIPTSPISESVVLDFAGARPSQRIPLEIEIMANIAARQGDYINCYSEVSDPRFLQVLNGGATYDDTFYTPPTIADRCELDAKGWTGWRNWLLPTFEINRRTLSDRLPSDLNTVLASGYTKLEAFLHACSMKVELDYGGCDESFIQTSGQGWTQ